MTDGKLKNATSPSQILMKPNATIGVAAAGILLTIVGLLAIAHEGSVAALRARETLREAAGVAARGLARELQQLFDQCGELPPDDGAKIVEFTKNHPELFLVSVVGGAAEAERRDGAPADPASSSILTLLDEAAFREFTDKDYSSAERALAEAARSASSPPARASVALARAGFESRRGDGEGALRRIEELLIYLQKEEGAATMREGLPALPLALLMKTRLLQQKKDPASAEAARAAAAELCKNAGEGAEAMLEDVIETGAVAAGELDSARADIRNKRESKYLEKLLRERRADWLAGEAGPRLLDSKLAFRGPRRAGSCVVAVLDGERFLNLQMPRAAALAKAAGIEVLGSARAGILVNETAVAGSLGTLRTGVAENVNIEESPSKGALYALGALVVLLGCSICGGAWFLARAAAREVEAARAKSEFLAGVTHELKTPLASIRLYGEMLQEGRVADVHKKNEYIQTIGREARRLTLLIDRVLDLARFERGRGHETRTIVRAGELFQNVETSFSPLAKEVNLQLTSAVEGPDTSILCDPVSIEQAMLDLLDNAKKYAAAGGMIELRGRVAGEHYHIEIADRGPGLPSGKSENLFQMFARGDGDSVRGKAGLGIGLALARRIVESNGGALNAKNREGGGAIFTIQLPIQF